ncbi:MAG: hypothetical protein ACKOB1_11465 [Planctomycetia bacterium]
MRAAVAGIFVGVALAAAGAADDAGPGGRGFADAWRLDRVSLADGRSLAGLLVEEPDDARGDVVLVEVVRRPGRPMHLVTRRLPARLVASIDRLAEADRAALAARIEAFRTSGRAEREAAAALALSRSDDDAPWRYEGPWFTLESSAGQPLTRQAIVRLEALLDAFENLVPASAQGDPARRLAVRLCGSQAEYARAQAEQGVKVANPVFYLPERGLLVAGSDVPAVIEQARLAADGLDATAQRQKELDAEVTAGLRRLAAELEAQGIPGGERAEIVDRTRARWQRERAAILADVDQARKDNEARVKQARDEFFTALAHEAWHAYADLRLGQGGRLPAWLDEGLAQVFETGLLEAGELRLDAPDPRRLAQLADLLAAEPRGALGAVIDGGENQFVVGHGNAAATSRRAYLLAWGVAYDLVLGAPALSVRGIEEAARSGPEAGGERARFERLVGMPVEEFETEWRARMLNLARPRPVAQ